MQKSTFKANQYIGISQNITQDGYVLNDVVLNKHTIEMELEGTITNEVTHLLFQTDEYNQKYDRLDLFTQLYKCIGMELTNGSTTNRNEYFDINDSSKSPIRIPFVNRVDWHFKMISLFDRETKSYVDFTEDVCF